MPFVNWPRPSARTIRGLQFRKLAHIHHLLRNAFASFVGKTLSNGQIKEGGRSMVGEEKEEEKNREISPC